VARIGRTVVVLAICVLTASLRSAPVDLPPIPPLPGTGWPLAENAEPFARALIAHVPPQELDAIASSNPEVVPGVFRNLGSALLSHDASLQAAVKAYATALVHARAARIAHDVSSANVQMLVVFQVLDPLRYAGDEEYRRVVDTILPASLSPSLPEGLRRAAINELNRVAPISFDTAEALTVSAGLVTRPSRSRFVDAGTVGARILTNGSEVIEASIYSINSRFVKPAEAKRFLSAVRAAAPERRIIVVGDDATRSALANDLSALRIDFIDNFNRPLTPWPRDPFSVARTPDGRVVFVNRPNQQHNREEDATMVRVLLDNLPKSLDERWKAHWTTGATSFHNGQVLLTANAAWISMHSVEFRATEILGLDRVPVEEFGSAAGVARYAGAVQRAAKELAELYGRPVRFIHELPRTSEQIATLGGGAGFDLDSIVTLLTHGDGSTEALVGDLALGGKLGAGAPFSEWREMEKTYALRVGARDAVINFQHGPAATGLQRFLDRIAQDLAATGMKVRRLPLLMVPSSLLTSDDERPETPYFLVTWNNVVLERNRAEGFASGLASGDRAARSAFKAAGYDLTLFPPLPRSVVLNGGYRCASNEVRVIH
jgi:hypothetical protein